MAAILPRLTRLRQMFIVLAQPPVTSQPGECSLHYPTNGQRLELLLPFWPTDHRQVVGPSMHKQPVVQIIVVILAIAEDYLQAAEIPATHLRKDMRSPRASSTLAAVTATAMRKPSVSTRICRLRP